MRSAKLDVYPKGAVIDAALKQALHADVAGPSAPRAYILGNNEHPAGLFVDMNGDDIQEFVLLGSTQSALYQKQGEAWQYAGLLSPPNYAASGEVAAQLQAGNFSAVIPRWHELRIGERHFRYQGEP